MTFVENGSVAIQLHGQFFVERNVVVQLRDHKSLAVAKPSVVSFCSLFVNDQFRVCTIFFVGADQNEVCVGGNAEAPVTAI